MKFDLHIHSCLSPCANLEMSPGDIVARAVAAGMGGIALTDHNLSISFFNSFWSGSPKSFIRF